MYYQEGKYEEIKDIDQQKNGWKNLGDYGWGFSIKNVELIKKITKEDGWKIFKILDPNENKTGGYPRSYYFISDKYKVFVPVSQQAWNREAFQKYLEHVIGKQQS